jgi:hypothetical protein
MSRHRRPGVVVGVLFAVLAMALSTSGVAAYAGRAGSDPPMDYRYTRFALADLAPDQLPYQTSVDPPLPPEWLPMDPDGILMKEIGGTLFYHPVELADATYRLLNAYRRTHDEGYLDWARRYLEKIRSLSVPSDGALFVPYEFDYAPHGVTAPWYSGMAQGMALTVFVRMYRVTGEMTYLETAQAFLKSFDRSGPSSRPWVSRIIDRELWFEEYPVNAHPDRVLNGFMFAVYGLYEYWQLTRERTARHLLEGALTTLKANVLRYRVPDGISYYCLRHRQRYEHYHFVHIKQLGYIARMSGDPFFSDVADLLRADHPPNS